MKNPQVLIRAECPKCEGFGIATEPSEINCRTCDGNGHRKHWMPLHEVDSLYLDKTLHRKKKTVLAILPPKPKSPLEQLADASIISKNALNED